MKPVSSRRIKKHERKKPVVKRGAVRAKAAPTEKRHLPLVRIFLLLSFLGVVGYFGFKVDWQSTYARASQLVTRPISSIEVRGEFRFISKDTIYALMNEKTDGSFVNLNLREIKSRVEGVPWVESVNISRVWPDGILLKVREQKPIARWGETGFINQYGEIVRARELGELDSLPVLFGDEKQGEEITRTYLDVAELLSANGVSLRGLFLDEKRAWTLQFNNDIEIILGRDDVIQKLRNFVYVYDKKLREHESDIEQIDLRYRSGLAVRWKAREEKIANSNINKLLVKVN